MKELDWIFDEEELNDTDPLKKGDIIRFDVLNHDLKVKKVSRIYKYWIFKTENNNWFYYDEKVMKIIK